MPCDVGRGWRGAIASGVCEGETGSGAVHTAHSEFIAYKEGDFWGRRCERSGQ